jgi:two-component system cell cycle sensor histidine kinase/response regulator CckA
LFFPQPATEHRTDSQMVNSSIGKILVVDDEVELKNILVEALTSQGYETSGFTSGEEALAALRGEAFDVLLTDLMMPGMDGITLVRESLQIDPYLVAIVMTGQGTIQTAVDAMKVGAFDYVLKPFRLQTMLPVLTRAMNARHLRLENVQLREAIAIHELSQTIAFTLEPQTVLSKLADAALQQSEADEVSVLLPTADGAEFYVAAVRGEKRERLLGERVPFGQSISGWVARQHTPVILNGEVNDDRFVALWPRSDISSSVSIPMLVAKKLVGVLNLNVVDKPRPFTLGQMKALTILAGTAAAALESASLYTQVQQAEENYRSIFENAIEGVFRGTPDGQKFFSVNPAMAKMFGYDSPAEMVKAVVDITGELGVKPERRDAALRRLSEQGELKNFEERVQRKDGSEIWISANVHAVSGAKDELLYLDGIVQDITERKKAEAAQSRLNAEIREQRERLDTIVATVPGVVFESWGQPNSSEHRTDFVSDYVQAMLGYSAEEWLSIPGFWFSIVHPDDRERVAKESALQFAESRNGELEFRWIGKDKRVVWVRAHTIIVRDRGGKAIGVRGVVTDMTARKQAEAQRERLAVVVEASPDFIGYADPKTTQIQYINKHGRRMCGIGEDEDIGKLKISDLHPAWMNKRMADVVLPAAVRDGLWEGEGAFLHRNGREIPVLMTLLARKAANGEVDLFYTVSRDITERKRAEEALRESEERYKGLIDSAFDGALIHRDGMIVSANRAYAEMFGYGVEELIGMNVMEFTTPEYREFVQGQISADESTYESVGLRRDGTRIPVEISGQVCMYEGQRARLAAVRDITERKRAEEIQARRVAHAFFRADVSAALAISRAPLRATLESCAAAMVQHLSAAFARIWTLNREGDVLELQASAGMYTHIDGPHSRVPVGSFKIGKIAQERAPHITSDLQNDPRVSDKEWAAQNGMVAFAGYPLIVEDRLLGVMALFSRDELPEDTLDALASVADLISQGIDRKRAEEALRESEERYRDLVENAHDLIYSHDLQGNYTSMNRAGETITGYTREEALSLSLSKTVAPESLGKVQEMLRRKLAGEKVTAYEMEIIAKDGRRIPVEANTKLVYQDGVPVGVQGIARDVTERKQLEEQLRQSQKLEAIGQLAGGVAHDFNNLLTAINGYSSLALQRLEDDHPIKPYLEEVKKAGDRAANLTRQLLAFGRKQILQPLPLNLNFAVSDMNKMLRLLIGEDIQLTAKLDPDVGKVMADPGQIEQVLVNLIVNARDAMPRGGHLTIETKNVELDQEYGSRHIGVAPGKYVLLAVSDTGEGMSEEVRRRVFEPFFTTKEKGKGTGLGLSTVYGIVKQSGGNVWVYSEPGKGTTFKVYLPQVESETRGPGEKVVEAAPRGGSETILLVEDEEVVRGLARRILEQVGYSVVEASRADEALRFWEEHAKEVDLLLTDVVMPEMSGKELADQMKSQCPELKMLFMSGYTDEAIVHHGVLDSSVEFIQKPFTPAGLVKRVRDVLDSNGKSR